MEKDHVTHLHFRLDHPESKLHDAMLAFAIARRWPGVFSNSLEPGWVPTRMGGSSAPDDIDQAQLTQAPEIWALQVVEILTRDVRLVIISGGKPRTDPNAQAQDPALQDSLIAICAATISSLIIAWRELDQTLGPELADSVGRQVRLM